MQKLFVVYGIFDRNSSSFPIHIRLAVITHERPTDRPTELCRDTVLKPVLEACMYVCSYEKWHGKLCWEMQRWQAFPFWSTNKLFRIELRKVNLASKTSFREACVIAQPELPWSPYELAPRHPQFRQWTQWSTLSTAKSTGDELLSPVGGEALLSGDTDDCSGRKILGRWPMWAFLHFCILSSLHSSKKRLSRRDLPPGPLPLEVSKSNFQYVLPLPQP